MSSVPDWLPSPRARAALVTRLNAAAPAMTDAALADIAASCPWIHELDPEYRSWIHIIVRSGVDGFVRWLAEGAHGSTASNIFEAAPRPLQRQITLQQTLELIRSTISSVETFAATRMPRGDRAACRTAILHYSREVAFDAAQVYAHAAETRGAWDARVEAMVMDAVIRGEASEAVVSRASTLGWRSPRALAVLIGPLADTKETTLRRLASQIGLDVLLAPHGDRLVALLGGDFSTDAQALAVATRLNDAFGDGPLVLGPPVAELADAVTSARAALAGYRAVAGWPDAPRPVLAHDLLPERALAGDGHARRHLVQLVHRTLNEHGGDLLPTLSAYLDAGSIEAASRTLYVHANTVRYRLAKIEDLTGLSPLDQRDAYSLRLGLTLGRLLG